MGVISGDIKLKGKAKISTPLVQNNWGTKWGYYTQRQCKRNTKSLF